MRTLLLVSLLLNFVSPVQDGAVSDPAAPVAVLAFKWTKSRQAVEQTDNSRAAPAPAMIPANKNFQRNARINDPMGTRDPNADTIDGRSAAIEKNVQDSRKPKRKEMDGFAYQAKIRNAGSKVVEVLFWEYQFKEASNPTNVVRRQFLCGVNIKAGKEKELRAFSLAGPSSTISIESLSKESANLFEEKVVVNRVEYADGSIWQRKDWNFAEMRSAIAIATGTPWGAEMCRQL